MLDKVYVVHFSPAGNTRKAALMLAGELAAQVEEYDLTLPLGEQRSFAPSDVVIAAGPGFGGGGAPGASLFTAAGFPV